MFRYLLLGQPINDFTLSSALKVSGETVRVIPSVQFPFGSNLAKRNSNSTLALIPENADTTSFWSVFKS